MATRRSYSFTITLASTGVTSDPAWAGAPAAAKAEACRWVAVLGLKAKDAELAAGLNRYGRPLPPVKPSTAKHRKSVMGPASPGAPYLQPAYAVSRTRLLLEGQPTASGATFSWSFDAHVGESWGVILGYHRDRGRRYDVIGLSPAARAEVAAEVRRRWREYARTGFRVVPGPLNPRVPTPAPGLALVTTGRTDYEHFTFGIGGTGAPAPGVLTTGFRQLRPGQGRTAFGGPLGGMPPRPPQPPPGPRPVAPPPPIPAPAVRTVGAVSPAFAEDIRRTVAALPGRVRQALHRHGVTFEAAPTLPDAVPALRGQRPRGWSEGRTWADVGGACSDDGRRVVLAEAPTRPQAGTPDGTTRHEVGHAYDAATGRLSETPEFVAAHAEDSARLDAADRAGLKYYLQPGAAGRREAFAELFAQMHGTGGETGHGRDLARFFPRAAAFLRRFLG